MSIDDAPEPTEERRVLRLDARARVLIERHLRERAADRVVGFFEEPRERRPRREP